MARSLEGLPSCDAGAPIRKASDGEPVWALAEFFPAQGSWTEEQYLSLETNRLIEFDDGRLEFPPMPSLSHQLVLQELLVQLRAKLKRTRMLTAPYKFRLRPNKVREPDLLYVADGSALTNLYATAADLCVEILSPGGENEHRDLVEKRAEYASHGVRHYWIVDPLKRTLLILELDGQAYKEVELATSGTFEFPSLADGLKIDVGELFAVLDEAES